MAITELEDEVLLYTHAVPKLSMVHLLPLELR
jgi:hypothetical protein